MGTSLGAFASLVHLDAHTYPVARDGRGHSGCRKLVATATGVYRRLIGFACRNTVYLGLSVLHERRTIFCFQPMIYQFITLINSLALTYVRATVAKATSAMSSQFGRGR